MKKLKLILIFLMILIPNHIFGLYFHYTPYSGMLKEIKTKHFIVVFPKGYEDIGRKAASYAEDAHILLEDFFQWDPYQRTTLILSPETDSANGMAMPSLRNTIVIYLAQLELENSLNESSDPLWTTIVHEYTHVLHIDQLRGAGWFWRVLYGKLYFPNSATFNWNVEGMATLTESIFSDAGRLRSAYSEALVADAARHHAIPPFCRLIPPYREFPYGHAVYHFGARFLEYLYTTYGKAKFQAFFIDLSYDFLPFVPMFVLTFKKVYGRTLKELWAEWVSAEEARYCDASQNVITSENDIADITLDETHHRLTDNHSNIIDFDIDDDGRLFYASSGTNSDNYIYMQNIQSGSDVHKLRHGSIRDICADGHLIYYTKDVNRCDNKSFYDLFVYDCKTGRHRRITRTGHINYVAAKNGIAAFVRHGIDSAEIAIMRDADSDPVVMPIHIDGIRYIDRISFNGSGSAIIFAGKLDNGQRNIYVYQMHDNQCNVILEDTDASSVEWIDDNRISFILNRNRHNSVCEYDIPSGQIKCLMNEADIYPYIAKVRNGKLYYAGYTYSGEEIFETGLPDTPVELAYSDVQRQPLYFDDEADRSHFNQYGVHIYEPRQDYKITSYHFGRYLLPPIWGFIPTTLDSSVYLTDSFSMPFIAPQFMVMNESPTGRLSYTASITYDYIKNYPVNALSMTVRLPCISINFNWNNWAGGTALWYKNAIRYSSNPSGVSYRFPVCFSDSVSLNGSFVLSGYDSLIFSVQYYHQFRQWDMVYSDDTEMYTSKFYSNQMTFTQSFGYQYIVHRSGASRWDRGFYINTVFYESPGDLFDNTALYITDLDIQFRLPICRRMFEFTAIQCGMELNDPYNAKKVYRVDSALYKLLGKKIDSIGNTSLNVIDGKAFSSQINNSSTGSGFAYISANVGFDFTVCNRPHYWHFATLGFKEFFIRVYNQYIYLFDLEPKLENFFIDVAAEFVLDLTVGYGNLGAQFCVGAAIGYQGGRNVPSYGVNFNLAFGIGN